MSVHRNSSRLELIISIVLQLGIFSSALIILIGLTLFLTHNEPLSSSYYRYTTATYSFPHSVSTIRDAIKSKQGSGFIELGILLLILTPIARVATSVILFLRQQDKPMLFITSIVLLLLISSFALGVVVR